MRKLLCAVLLVGGGRDFGLGLDRWDALEDERGGRGIYERHEKEVTQKAPMEWGRRQSVPPQVC